MDQERVSLAIDWLPIDSNPAAKKEVADEALVARQRELDEVSPSTTESFGSTSEGTIVVT